MKQKILQVTGVIGIVLIVGVTVYGLFMMFVWDPSHRPVVVFPGNDRAPWSIDVDGKRSCSALPVPIDEAKLKTCQITLGTGAHTLVARSADGAEIYNADVTIARGEASYLWAPEIPKGLCVRMRDEKYRTGPQLPAFLNGPDTFTNVEPGFRDVGKVDLWFKEPPNQVQSQDSETVLKTVRLEACAERVAP